MGWAPAGSSTQGTRACGEPETELLPLPGCGAHLAVGPLQLRRWWDASGMDGLWTAGLSVSSCTSCKYGEGNTDWGPGVLSLACRLAEDGASQRLGQGAEDRLVEEMVVGEMSMGWSQRLGQEADIRGTGTMDWAVESRTWCRGDSQRPHPGN